MALDKLRDMVTTGVGKLLSDPGNADRLAKAIGAFQKGQELARGAQTRAMKTLGLATNHEVVELRRELSSLGRRMKRLEVDENDAEVDAGETSETLQ